MNPADKMWRTLVRVSGRSWTQRGVYLIIPGWNVDKNVFCPRQAIPPDIFNSMELYKRYHVGCNIGAEKASDLCFDGWEAE